MEIFIDDDSKISEIQEEFSQHYPNLKLVFFGFETTKEKVFKKENMIIDPNKTIGEIRHVHHLGNISINGHQKVNTLEHHFKENLGINIQVFRKSGGNWLLTTATDNWTLAEQNKQGEEMNNAINEEAPEDFDQYHEQL